MSRAYKFCYISVPKMINSGLFAKLSEVKFAAAVGVKAQLRNILLQFINLAVVLSFTAYTVKGATFL